MPGSFSSGALASTEAPLHTVHDLLLLDLDGVVYRGADAVPAAADTLLEVTQAGGRIAYLTNNASRTAHDVAEHLEQLGMPVRSDADVVTAAQAVAGLMAEQLPSGSAVLVIGGEGLRAPLVEVGLRPVSSLDDEPAAVVQGFHPNLTWGHLAEASYAVNAGLPWYASNTDLTIPTARGTAPGNGSLVRAVATATGREPVVAGKPERPLFDEAISRSGATSPLMVGDRLDTDIDGAIGLGMASLTVLTGVTGLDDLIGLDARRRPSFVASDLTGLLDVHHQVHLADGETSCGDTSARCLDGVISVSEEALSTDGLRAALTLAWQLADDDRPASRVDLPAPRGLTSGTG